MGRQRVILGTITCTEGREPSGLAMESLSRVLGDAYRYPTQKIDCFAPRMPTHDKAVESLRNRLTGDTPNREDGEIGLDTVDRFVFDGETELALNAAVYVADANCEAGIPIDAGFWFHAERLCNDLLARPKRSTYDELLLDTQRTIVRHQVDSYDECEGR